MWQEPIPELQSLRRDGQKMSRRVIPADKPARLPSLRGDALEIVATVDRAAFKRCGLIVRANGEGEGMKVWADAGNGFGIEGRVGMHFLGQGESVNLHVFVDSGILEVYCDCVAVTHKCFAPAGKIEVFAFSDGGDAIMTGLEAWNMQSMRAARPVAAAPHRQ